MSLPAAIAQSEQPSRTSQTDYINETVDILLAAMQSDDHTITPDNISGIFRSVHGAVLDLATAVGSASSISSGLPQLSENSTPFDPLPALKEIGLDFASARLVKRQGEVQPAAFDNVVPITSAVRAESLQPRLPLDESQIATVTRLQPRTAASAKDAPAAPKLPRRLKSVEDALQMDSIICLEDGRKVKDLGAHLKSLGVSEEQYLQKWGLPTEYPMQAPSLILKKGATFEVDFSTGRRRALKG